MILIDIARSFALERAIFNNVNFLQIIKQLIDIIMFQFKLKDVDEEEKQQIVNLKGMYGDIKTSIRSN